MASSKRHDPEGLYKRGRFYYCWVRGKRFSTRAQTRKEALEVKRRLSHAFADPVYRASLKATVGELCAVTIQEVERRKRSAATVEYYSTKLGHIVRVMGADLPLAEISAGSVDAYIDTRRKEDAVQHTISKELGALRHMLRVAKRRLAFAGDVDSLFPIGFGKDYEPRRRSLTWEEIPKLLPELAPRWRAWVAFALVSGARKIEVERAEASDVSPARDVVQIRGSKTDLSDDAVAVPVAFRSLLDLALDLGAKEGPLVGHWGNATRDLAEACMRAGIVKVTPNDLRRTHATLLRASGTSVDLVARQLRHTDSRMVQRVYGRLTATQVGALLPAAESTVQNRHIEPGSCTGAGSQACVIVRVSDGDRTRDNRSHMPIAELATGVNPEKTRGDKDDRDAGESQAPYRNSTVALRQFRARSWMWFMARRAAA